MKKICIVASKYYEDIINMLIDGANEAINNHKKKFQTNVIYVPGVFEIPYAISKNLKKYDAFIALGCVIKGETPHFDFISKSSINAIMKLSIENKKPIGNGILTCLNKDQAVERADKSNKNKGKEAVDAAIELLIGDN
tara:strand:- start:659 stop:1072 length:414 start_codon:yes stop_codon:yes gene_type:complete